MTHWSSASATIRARPYVEQYWLGILGPRDMCT